jgi:hypothetical protein
MLKCIVIEDSDSAITSTQSNNEKVDKKISQQRPKTNHCSGNSGRDSSNTVSTKSSSAISQSRD